MCAPPSCMHQRLSLRPLLERALASAPGERLRCVYVAVTTPTHGTAKELEDLEAIGRVIDAPGVTLLDRRNATEAALQNAGKRRIGAGVDATVAENGAHPAAVKSANRIAVPVSPYGQLAKRVDRRQGDIDAMASGRIGDGFRVERDGVDGDPELDSQGRELCPEVDGHPLQENAVCNEDKTRRRKLATSRARKVKKLRMKQGLAAQEVELFDVVEQLSEPRDFTIEDFRARQDRRAERTEVIACPAREVAVVGDLNVEVGQNGSAAQDALAIPEPSLAETWVRCPERVSSCEDLALEGLTKRARNDASPQAPCMCLQPHGEWMIPGAPEWPRGSRQLHPGAFNRLLKRTKMPGGHCTASRVVPLQRERVLARR